MKQLPENVKAYNKSQTYTYNSTPGMMKNNHRTRAGVWAKIIVQKGEVLYHIEGDDEVYTLSSEVAGIIEPTIFHKIDPQQGPRFAIEFYRN